MVGLALIALAAALEAGAARAVITPDLKVHGPVYMAGFGNNRIATGVHDDLYARCFAFKAATTLVICGVDSIGLFLDDTDRIRSLVAKQIKASVIIAASHTHQGPDTMGLWGLDGKTGINEAYMSLVTRQTAQAAIDAVKSLQPATLTIAETHPGELDTFIHDSRPPDRHDAQLYAVKAVDAKGQTIATLINWANHPEALASKNTLITSDYVNSLRTTVEAKLGGISVFVNGAIGGMQSPLNTKLADLKDGTFEKADYIGRRVGEIAIQALAQSQPSSIDTVEFKEVRINIPLTNKGFAQAMALNLYAGRKPLNKNGTTTTIVGAFRFSNKNRPVLECALIPGEMYPELSIGGVERYLGADFPEAPIETPIKHLLQAPYKMLIGLANDEIGYIIPKAEWDETAPWLQDAKNRWYGEVNSIGPDAAPYIAKTLEKLLKNAN